MVLHLNGDSGIPVEEGTEEAIKNAGNNSLRLFNVAEASSLSPLEDVKGEWKASSPEMIGNYSAIAYYFGRMLQKTLDVPVGLVVCARGGTRIELWMSREMLSQYPQIDLPQVSSDTNCSPGDTPTEQYNGMIHPLKGLGIKGMVWYQGEANVSPKPNNYKDLFETFVALLRKDWNQGNFPFYFFQIAPFSYGEPNSAYLREAQLQAESSIPDASMVVLMDLGEAGNIHPVRKRQTGERLAQQTLAHTYGLGDIPHKSPAPGKMEIRGNEVVLNFVNAPTGLTSHGKPLTIFTIAGDDRVFHPANARIEGSQVFISSEKVSKPQAVRYGFENFANGELFNNEGFPVSSFRTDSFEE